MAPVLALHNSTPLASLNHLNKEPAPRLKLSLNAYSFNEPLRNGSMSLNDLLEFCALHEFDAVDITGYYFPNYPKVPPDDFIFGIKRRAFALGLDISGTGIRNDFSIADEAKRRADVELIKQWIFVASKLGAPVIRIFSGLTIPKGYTWNEVARWMVRDIKECVAFGKEHGVVVAVQNHNDFIQTAAQVETLIGMVSSEWFGLVLDIGSYRAGDPYAEIKQTAKYAVNWQLKENLYIDGKESKTDVRKIIDIVRSSGYRGYLPIETLGAGDPKIKVPLFLAEVRKALGSA
ncbi:MAG TPA: sugar phosphate isomerase/epimerase family protein [Chitinophagaceae bacterium]|nr:sugar phosphate isomerase/epimerase family protein [Chitinophagaceae bacterium]